MHKHIDSKYVIGHSHDICQDYAVSGHINENISFAIISDGCSSSKNVDVGARLLLLNTIEFLRMNFKDKENIDSFQPDIISAMENYIISSSYLCSNVLHLPVECLNATLVLILCDNNKAVSIMYGDGVVLIKGKGGIISSYLSYDMNAPYYLRYMMDEEAKKNYLDEYKDQKITEILEFIGSPDFGIINNTFSVLDFSNKPKLIKWWENKDTELFIVTSDGIHSFLDIDINYSPGIERRQPTKAVPYQSIVKELCNVKNYNGSFLKRTMERMKRDFTKIERIHYDDISVSAIHLEK